MRSYYLLSLLLISVCVATPVRTRAENTTVVSMEKFQFHGLPCSCQGTECGCCVTIEVKRLDWTQRGCLNFSYVPSELAIKMNVYFNNNSIYENSLSGKNPPRFCIPLPQFPLLMFCIRLYDIQTQGNNLHVCINVEVRIQDATLLVFSFDCIRIGSDGFGIEKPTSPPVGASEVIEGSQKKNSTSVVTKLTEWTTVANDMIELTTTYETTTWDTTDETTTELQDSFTNAISA